MSDMNLGVEAELELASFSTVVHDSLQPSRALHMFPNVTINDLRELQAAGWSRVGIVAAVINEAQQILMLEHAESDKNPEGALGPLAETTLVRSVNNQWQVEDTITTLYRCFREELGITNPEQVGLAARKIGAWTLNRWPVGGERHKDKFALAVCPVITVPEQTVTRIGRFINTHEIRRAYFMKPEQILDINNVRPGTHQWLIDIISSGLLNTPSEEKTEVDFSHLEAYGWRDAKLEELDL